MPLPKCVKVNEHDHVSRETLEGEGWRYVGTLDTYEGEIDREVDPRVTKATPDEAWNIATKIDWTGRLWRDFEIPTIEAWAETERFIRSDEYFLYKIGGAAFGIFDEERIALIGVHPAAQGIHLAERLIRNQFSFVRAGTYSDNTPAIKLYRRLGMKFISSQAVFHK